GSEQKRVPVGSRLRDQTCTERATCSRSGFEYDRLSQSFTHLGTHHPREDVRRAAWRERDDEAYRFGREAILRSSSAGGDRDDDTYRDAERDSLQSWHAASFAVERSSGAGPPSVRALRWIHNPPFG